MNQMGSLSIILLFPVTLFGTAAALFGGARNDPRSLRAAERSLLFSFLLATAAVVFLAALFLRDGFHNAYVAGHSSLTLPLFYKIAGVWAGQDGSLLFWNWLITLFGVIVQRTLLSGERSLMPGVLAIILFSSFFFTAMNLFAVNPFRTLIAHGPGGIVPFIPFDGNGMNPLLQHPVMVIHPPLLFLGYAGFVVPFALAMAALVRRSSLATWLPATRRWALFSWLMLSAGILLGMRWAYVELGWGGYWSWDPVENASLLPWFTATAFLHAAIAREKKGILKMWSVSLLIATYFLCIFGTFITRSGIISSVHAFARSSIGWYFLLFMGGGVLLSLVIVIARRGELRSDFEIQSILSRESAFLLNNLVLLAACVAVLWGTIYPVFSGGVAGEQVAVGASYYNRISVPIGLFLLLLTGMSYALGWRSTSWNGFARKGLFPAAAAAAFGAVLFLLGVRHAGALATFSIGAYLAFSVFSRLAGGISGRRRRLGVPLHRASVGYFLAHPRRFGGSLTHLGVALLFAGIAGTVYNQSVSGELQAGEDLALGTDRFQLDGTREGETPLYDYYRSEVVLMRDENPVHKFLPEMRQYKADGQMTSEVEIRSTIREDVYVVFSYFGPNNGPVIQVYRNPLVRWIWIGGIVLAVGSLVCFLPSRREEEAA